MDYLADLRQFHHHAVQPFRGVPVGCTPDTLLHLEQAFAHPLPLAYRQFLAWMGEDYVGVFQGTNCFVSDIPTNTAALPELLAENGITVPLPHSYLVFYLHQGYVAAWFALPAESDNPPVWFFTEGADQSVPIKVGTLTDFLLDDMKGLAPLLRPTGDHPP
jgi:hypothetical protein